MGHARRLKTSLPALLGAAALACAAALWPAGPARAQEATDTISREEGDMLRLFFTSEQRRILEAVRQGLLKDEALDRVQEIATAALMEFESETQGVGEELEIGEFLDFDNPQVRERGRSTDVTVDGFIRIGDRNSTLLVNGRMMEAPDLLNAQGIEVNRFKSDTKGSLIAVDMVSKQRIVLKPGQTISTSGSVRENLAVSNPPEIASFGKKEAADPTAIDVTDILPQDTGAQPQPAQ